MVVINLENYLNNSLDNIRPILVNPIRNVINTINAVENEVERYREEERMVVLIRQLISNNYSDADAIQFYLSNISPQSTIRNFFEPFVGEREE